MRYERVDTRVPVVGEAPRGLDVEITYSDRPNWWVTRGSLRVTAEGYAAETEAILVRSLDGKKRQHLAFSRAV